MTTCDIQYLLAGSLTKIVKIWGIAKTTVPTDTIQEMTKLGDAATFSIYALADILEKQQKTKEEGK